VVYEVREGPVWATAQVLARVAQPPFLLSGNGTYWVAAYSNPEPGIEVYSEAPAGIEVLGTATALVSAAAYAISYDEAATGWTGTLGGAAAVVAGVIETSSSGTYTLPAGHEISVGRVALCNVIVACSGGATTGNFLATAAFLSTPDFLGWSYASEVTISAQIAVSQDGVTWGAWQPYAMGSYMGQKFNVRVTLSTPLSTVAAILEDVLVTVIPPARTDHYAGLAVPSGGLTVSFIPDGAGAACPFLAGPAGGPTPYVQATIANPSAGDVLTVSALSLASVHLSITNGGSGVSRTVNLMAEGF
jgi:hypothetical protein